LRYTGHLYFDAFFDVLGEDKGEERLLFGGEFLVDEGGGVAGAVFAGFGRDGVGDVGEDVEEIAVFGVDDLLHFEHLIAGETPAGEAFEEFGAGGGIAPEGAEFVFVLEEFRESAEQEFHELAGGHGGTVWVPE